MGGEGEAVIDHMRLAKPEIFTIQLFTKKCVPIPGLEREMHNTQISHWFLQVAEGSFFCFVFSSLCFSLGS